MEQELETPETAIRQLTAEQSDRSTRDMPKQRHLAQLGGSAVHSLAALAAAQRCHSAWSGPALWLPPVQSSMQPVTDRRAEQQNSGNWNRDEQAAIHKLKGNHMRDW